MFGQTCLLCGGKDSDQDPVAPSLKRVWGHGVDTATGKNCGTLCKVCFRVYRAQFRGKHSNPNALKAAFGADVELHQLFTHWWNMCIQAMKDAGSHECSISWGSGLSSGGVCAVAG